MSQFFGALIWTNLQKIRKGFNVKKLDLKWAMLQTINTIELISEVWVKIICRHEAENVSYWIRSMNLLVFSSNGNDVLLKFVHIENHHFIEYPGPKKF